MFKKECRLLLWGLCSVVIATGAIGQQKTTWQMQPISIQTRWAGQVDPIHPLPEYPRPQMVRDNNWINLNGLWEYAITEKDVPRPSKYHGLILVPYPIESALSGVKKQLRPNENLWYRRTVNIDQLTGGKLLLHFGAVDWQSTIYVNGREIGSHTGGYTSFTFDITKALKSGVNEIIVKVLDPSEMGLGPHGKQMLQPGNIYYTATSGIWQTVWLEEVPFIHIRTLNINSDIDRSEISLDAKISFDDESDNVNRGNERVDRNKEYDLEIRVFDGNHMIKKKRVSASRSAIISMKSAKLWSPSKPFLYGLQVRIMKGNHCIDSVKSYLGMRKISINKDEKGIDRIFLNNKYLYNLGTLDQGFWPEGGYTAPTDQALLFDLMAIKAMAFNTVRKHIKVEPARWYYYADSLGLLVWQDMVNPNQSLPDGAKVQFENDCNETIKQLRFFPSIVVWTLFNERWGQYDQSRLTKWIKTLDPTRLINGHSGEYLYVNNELRSLSPNAYVNADMTDVHSYPGPRMSVKQQGKAQVCGEFGGIGTSIEGHVWDDLVEGWGYDGIGDPAKLKSEYRKMSDTLLILERMGLSASIYTQPFDVESEQNGLITYDREFIKLPIDTIREMNLRVLSASDTSVVTTEVAINVADQSPLRFSDKYAKYNAGQRDSLFLRRFAVDVDRQNIPGLLTKVIDDYIESVNDVFSYTNLFFIKRFTKTANGKAFTMIHNNLKKVDSILGKNEAENLIIRIIYRNDILPYESQPNPDWDKIEKDVVRKYGELGKESVWGHRLVYYSGVNDWKNFGKYFKLYFDKAIPGGRSFVHINNMSWMVFERVDDREVLEAAIRATKYNLDNFGGGEPEAIDTHANLLYKFGNTIDAIRWENLAVRLSKKEKVFVETLEKMKNGQPTWK
jgi:hypothetical protein